LNAEILEISYIASDDDQIMNHRGCSDHRVFDHMVRVAMHEARPGTEGPPLDAQYVVGFGNLLRPGFDLGRLVRILLARDLDPSLNLADRHGGEMPILAGNTFNPSENCGSAIRGRRG
jgi:hypothetical protein